MFTVSFEIKTPADLAKLQSLFAQMEDVPVKVSPVADKVEVVKTETVVEKSEPLTQMPADKAEAALSGSANRPADAPTYQDAATAITKLSRAKGKEAAIAVLKSFGAAKLPDVDESKFADVIAAANKALGE